jgi:hypothetical protein
MKRTFLRAVVRMKGKEGGRREKGKKSDRVWQKACFMGNKDAKIGRRTLSTGEVRSRMSFVEHAQSVQATGKSRVWATAGESP